MGSSSKFLKVLKSSKNRPSEFVEVCQSLSKFLKSLNSRRGRGMHICGAAPRGRPAGAPSAMLRSDGRPAGAPSAVPRSDGRRVGAPSAMLRSDGRPVGSVRRFSNPLIYFMHPQTS